MVKGSPDSRSVMPRKAIRLHYHRAACITTALAEERTMTAAAILAQLELDIMLRCRDTIAYQVPSYPNESGDILQ